MGGNQDGVADIFWQLFELSGLISAYLVYKEAESEEGQEEEAEGE